MEACVIFAFVRLQGMRCRKVPPFGYTYGYTVYHAALIHTFSKRKSQVTSEHSENWSVRVYTGGGDGS